MKNFCGWFMVTLRTFRVKIVKYNVRNFLLNRQKYEKISSHIDFTLYYLKEMSACIVTKIERNES